MTCCETVVAMRNPSQRAKEQSTDVQKLLHVKFYLFDKINKRSLDPFFITGVLDITQHTVWALGWEDAGCRTKSYPSPHFLLISKSISDIANNLCIAHSVFLSYIAMGGNLRKS